MRFACRCRVQDGCCGKRSVRPSACLRSSPGTVTVVWHKTEGVLRKSAESFKVRHRFADKKNVLLT